MRVKHLKRVTNFIVAHHRVVAVVIYLLGAASTLIVLSLARNVFVDENAFLLNGSPATFDEHDGSVAKSYADAFRDIALNLTSPSDVFEAKMRWVVHSVDARGFESYLTRGVGGSVIAHAIARATRGNGRESLVLMTTIGRGAESADAVTIGSALRTFERLGRAEWLAKDLIWVCVDGRDGEEIANAMAWLKKYHSPDVRGEDETAFERAGTITQAFAFDASGGDAVSAMRVKLEGWNGAYPNQDMFTMFNEVVKLNRVIRLPVTLEEEEEGGNAWERRSDRASVAKSAARFMWRAAKGVPTGVHAAFKKHSIDAISIESTVRREDHHVVRGSHAYVVIGQTLELTLRACNNLLELLHHSCFYYIMLGPQKFLGIAEYIAPQALMLVSLLLSLVKLATFGEDSRHLSTDVEWRAQHNWSVALARLALAIAIGALVGKSCILMNAIGLSHESVTVGVSGVAIVASFVFLRLTEVDGRIAVKNRAFGDFILVSQEQWVGVKVVSIAWVLFTMSACTFFNFALALLATSALAPICVLCHACSGDPAGHRSRRWATTILCALPPAWAIILSHFVGSPPLKSLGLLAEHHARWHTFALPLIFGIAFPTILLSLYVANSSNGKIKSS
ncbi:Gaa1-like, GPI transamidase component [Ostreococcus tauri]|uniref:Gaa1-like, GPI transamidase component n=1 Tax=Ostreococcus tauri TaxID=70448 RepID=A0A090M8G9_OSTTA|nr:Gaa1-like, GPI transamidase component [Ostreococcus tauri]CEF99002.1 Gaa1-like, GPI transamidase component [Ostreococcus tauri]|eukprot:XP_003081134.2 Gaa1-like, GPI transamidase component [Ostreococcus tauri]